MKNTIYTVIVVLILLLAAWLSSASTSKKLSEKYQSILTEIETAVSRGAWDAAAELCDKAKNDWEKDNPLLQTRVIHSDTDEINKGFGTLTVTIHLQDLLMTRIYLAELYENVGHLYHRDAFTLKNIL